MREKNRYEIGWAQAKGEAERRAWARTGFKNREHVRESARNLPMEEKLEILAEIFAEEIAKRHFERRVEFQEKLGKDMVVPYQEMVNWMMETYKGDEKTEWIIDTTWFANTRISSDFQLIDVRDQKKR